MPIYEYECLHHGVFEILFRRMPEEVPQKAPCPTVARKSPLYLCNSWSRLVPSLGVYGDAASGPMMRLSRERRRYHERAPERDEERQNRKRVLGSTAEIITLPEVREREQQKAGTGR